MNFTNYQQAAKDYCLDSAKNLSYLVTGLGAETGEILGKYAKLIRDEYGDGVMVEPYPAAIKEIGDALESELGDVLWFVAVLADYLDLDLDDIAQANLSKLESRVARGVVKGSGDNR
jgi:NTP pyrophosphatase (non-canonical NTP hydrolase)